MSGNGAYQMALDQEYESLNIGLPDIWDKIFSWAEQHAVTNKLTP
jgi:hypothetical protein